MDLLQNLMNIVIAPISVIAIIFITPPYLVFSFVSSILSCIKPENVAGKVVLITGASSGIGEYLAYEYARRGARLVLAARREDRLRQVADKAGRLGSPDVLVVPTDVTNIEHSQRLIDEAVNHFGQLDHLVNNAGIHESGMFDECNVSHFTSIMEVNFWGSVYSTRFAVPHLRKSKGKIVVISSAAGWFPLPRMSFYCASKAAQISFFETLRSEFGSDIGVTIVTPGFIESEMTAGDTMSKIHMNYTPLASTKGCAEAIVKSACRGDRYLTEPSWTSWGFMFQKICPELVEWIKRLTLITYSKSLKKD